MRVRVAFPTACKEGSRTKRHVNQSSTSNGPRHFFLSPSSSPLNKRERQNIINSRSFSYGTRSLLLHRSRPLNPILNPFYFLFAYKNINIKTRINVACSGVVTFFSSWFGSRSGVGVAVLLSLPLVDRTTRVSIRAKFSGKVQRCLGGHRRRATAPGTMKSWASLRTLLRTI